MELVNELHFFSKARNAAQVSMLRELISNLAATSTLQFSDEVETICITKSKPKHLIRVSRDFIRDRISNAEDLLFLLLHEVVHKFHQQTDDPRYEQLDTDNIGIPAPVLRHSEEIYSTIKEPLDRWVAGLIEDIRINAILCVRYFPKAVPLFADLYSFKRFPDVLMIPPVVLDTYRGRAIDLDPLFDSPWPSSQFTISQLPDPICQNRILPVFSLIKDLPRIEVESPLDPDLGEIHFLPLWEKRLALWYWKAWSPEENLTLAQLYSKIRPCFGKIEDLPLIGEHDKS